MILTQRVLASALMGAASLCLAGPGSLDPTFGTAGRVDLFLGQSTETLGAVAVQPDGKIVAVGFFDIVDVIVVRHLADGALDPAFGTAGTARLRLFPFQGRPAVVIQPDGKLVLYTSCNLGAQCLARLHADGSPDTAFGENGIAQVHLSSGNHDAAVTLQPDGKIVATVSYGTVFRATSSGVPDPTFGTDGYAPLDPGGANPIASGVGVHADGRIVMTGYFSSGQFAARRFNADGTHDASFNVVMAVDEGAYAAAGALQADGKVLIAGCTPGPSGVAQLVVARVLPTGAPDPAFGTNGVARHVMNGCARGIALRPDGRIALAVAPSPYSGAGFPGGLEAVQLMADGSLDSAFGTSGRGSADLPGTQESAAGIALQPDGSAVLAGNRQRRDMALARLTAAGIADSTFGTQGVILRELWLGGRSGYTRAVASAGGKIVVLAELLEFGLEGDPAEGESAVARLLTDGTLDASFGVSGQTVVSLASTPVLRNPGLPIPKALAVQPDGKILVAGLGEVGGVQGATIMRLASGGALDTGFGTAGRTLVATTTAPPEGGLAAIRLLGDGKILVAGKDKSDTVVDLVARLLPNGALDPAFGNAGLVRFPSSDTTLGSERVSLAVQADGKIVVSGLGGGTRFITARLLADGVPDSSFGANGLVAADAVPPGDRANGVHVHADGRIVATGFTRPPGIEVHPVFHRMNAAGQVDAATLGGGVLVARKANTNVAASMLDLQDRIVVVGSTDSDLGAAAARFHSNGARDTAFRVDPAFLAPLGTLVDVAVQPDGQLIVTAGTGYSVVLARLDGSGAPGPPGLPGDIDADGAPDAAEGPENLDPTLKDNDIFTVARLFAMQQYRDFLGREGDAGGVTHWTTQLTSGAQNRGQMVETYFNSAEFQGTGAPMARLYFAYFLRIPDYGGLNYWTGRFRAGESLEAISNLFAASPEFVATYGALDNAGFVDRVYRNVLGRAPDSGGLAHWAGQVNGGMTRGQMMVAFSESPEYRALIDHEIYVTMMYVGMLRRAPDPGGFAHWVNYRDQGNSGLALVNAFLAAPEYRSRFLP